MSFEPYHSRTQLAAPAANFTKPAPLQYDNSGERALAKANAETGLIIAAGFNQMREQYDQGKVMEANNEYNRIMSEGTAELMQKKQEAALNVVDEYDKLHQKALDRVRKDYRSFISFGPAGRAFNAYTERDNNTRRANMLTYQMNETEKYHDTQYQNQLASCVEFVGEGGYTDQALNEGLGRAEPLVRARFGKYGEEEVTKQMRAVQADMVSQAVSFAVGQGDYARMGSLAQRYGGFMSPATRVSLLTTLGKRQKKETELGKVQYIMQTNPNITYDELREFVHNSSAGDENRVLAAAQMAAVGKTMPAKREGCCQAVIMMGSNGGIPFCEAHEGEAWVPNLYREAIKEGSGVTVERYHGQATDRGDLFIYAKPGQYDPDNLDPEDLEHVTMSDGGAGFFGNSSSARDYEDENGEIVRGNGCIVHEEEGVEIPGLELAYVIRTGGGQRKSRTPLDEQEETDALWKEISHIRTIQAGDETARIKNAKRIIQDMVNRGETAGLESIPLQAATGRNGEINENVLTALETTVLSIRANEQKAAERAAKNAPKKTVTQNMLDYVEQEVGKGYVTEAKIYDFASEMEITDKKEIAKLLQKLDDYQLGRNIPYKSIEAYIPGLDKAKGEQKERMSRTIRELSQDAYKEILKENDGKLPGGDIQDWVPEIGKRVAKSFTEEYRGGKVIDSESWLPDFLAETEVTITKADLRAAGYISITRLGDDDRFMLLRPDGTREYMTGTEVNRLHGSAGGNK